MAFPCRIVDTGILDGVLKIKEYTHIVAAIVRINKHCTLLEQVAVLLEYQIHGHIQQGMARTNKRRGRFAGYIDQFFFKNHTLVTTQYGGSRITTRYAIVDITRNMLDLITAWLAFITISTKAFERFQEKGGNKMWLETTSGSAFHIFAHLAHAHHVHYLASEGTLFQQSLQVFAIEPLVDHAEEAITHIRTITVANGLDNQLA